MHGPRKDENNNGSFYHITFCLFSLVWTLHSCGVDGKINSPYERALVIIYEDRISSFQNLLEKDNFVTIY